jgi:hypothetical protein
MIKIKQIFIKLSYRNIKKSNLPIVGRPRSGVGPVTRPLLATAMTVAPPLKLTGTPAGNWSCGV